MSLPAVVDDDQREVKAWRGNRFVRFWPFAVVGVVVMVLLAPTRIGQELLAAFLSPFLYVLVVATVAAPFVFFAAAVGYSLFCAGRWVVRAVPEIPSFDAVAIGCLWICCGAVWLSAIEGVRPDTREWLVTGGVVVFGMMLLGLAIAHLVSPLFRTVVVGEAGLNVTSAPPRYVPFQDLSRLCVVDKGVVETDLIDAGAHSFAPPPGLTHQERAIAAVDTTGALVAELPLWGARGRRLEATIFQAYENWRARPRRGASLQTGWLARGEASLSTWLNHLLSESERCLCERAYRGHGYGVEALLDIFWDESLPQDVRGGAAFVLLKWLPADERVLVFDSVGAKSPPLVSTAAWCGARVSVRRLTRPYGEECLSEVDRETLRRLKRDAWLAIVPFGPTVLRVPRV